MKRIYEKDEQKKDRWESGQAVLHRELAEEPDEKAYCVKNSFGRLDYLKKGREPGQDKEGLSLEAFEAPGTFLHTEKEKYLDRSSMKKINHGERRKLYASEVPFHNQAFFYEMSGPKKGAAFLKCMKKLIHQQGHRTLEDAFGFLDQEEERLELKQLEENQNEHLPEISDQDHKRIDALKSRLLRKEAMERQLCNELQVMLDERTREEHDNESILQAPEEDEKVRQVQEHKDDGFIRRQLKPEGIPADNPEGTEDSDDVDTNEEHDI